MGSIEVLTGGNLETDLPYIDGVEWQSALLKLKSEKLLRDSINGFVTTAPSDIASLKIMYEAVMNLSSEESFSTFRTKAHSMKTTAATIGAYHVAGLAKYLEYAARDKDSSVINAIMPVFEREWVILKDSIISELHMEDNDDNLPPILKEDLFKLLDTLEAAMNEYDIDGADAVIEQLAKHSYSDDETEIFKQVKLHVTNLDTEDCNEVLAKWKNIY